MFRKLFYYSAFMGLLIISSLPVQAQDSETCNFEVNQEANVFNDLQTVTDAGISSEDVQEIAGQIRGNEEVDLEQLLIDRGYSPEEVQAFLEDETNFNSLYNIVSPSPSRDLLERAYALLGSYGLPSSALSELYGLTGDFNALYNNLLARGLSPEQAEALANEGLSLAAEASSAGVFRYASTLGGEEVFDEHGYAPQLLYAVGDELGDEAALTQALLLQGIDNSDVDALASDLIALKGEIGLTEHTVNGWMLELSMYQAEYYGLPEKSVETLAAQENPEAFSACLEEAGLDEFVVDAALTGFGDILYNAEDQDGSDEVSVYLDEESIEDTVYYEMADLLYSYGLTPEDMSDLWSVSDEPEALTELLLSYGIGEEEADLFLSDFYDSAFADFVDDFDESALAELEDSLTEVEEDYQILNDEDISDEVGDTEEDVTDDEDSLEDPEMTNDEDNVEATEQANQDNNSEADGESDTGTSEASNQ